MTGSQLLFSVLERFRDYGEAEDCIVIYTDENNHVRLKANCNHTRSLGLAAWAKADIEAALVNAEGGETEDEE